MDHRTFGALEVLVRPDDRERWRPPLLRRIFAVVSKIKSVDWRRKNDAAFAHLGSWIERSRSSRTSRVGLVRSSRTEHGLPAATRFGPVLVGRDAIVLRGGYGAGRLSGRPGTSCPAPSSCQRNARASRRRRDSRRWPMDRPQPRGAPSPCVNRGTAKHFARRCGVAK